MESNKIREYPITPFSFCLFAGGIGFLFLLIFCFWSFSTFTKQDQRSYRRLMERSELEQVVSQLDYKTHQQRFNIHKHFLLVEGTDRLHFRLRSTSSDFVFHQEGHKSEIVEHFKEMKCLMQESLSYFSQEGKEQEKFPHLAHHVDSELIPKQCLRYIEADTADYYYGTKQLIAEQVLLSRYLAPGHRLATSIEKINPFMTGRAKTIRLSLSNKDRSFKAQGFQGTFQDLGQAL